MTSFDFIKRCINGQQIKSRSVASIYFDGETIYSYGTHYPLLFKINNKWILNDRGYSATTGKHISWAGSFNDYTMALPNFNNGKHDIDTIGKSIVDEQIIIKKRLKELPKRAWKQKEILQARYGLIGQTLEFIIN